MQKIKRTSLRKLEKIETQQPTPTNIGSWLLSSGIVVSTLTAGGYLTGKAFHQAYLNTFKLPSGLFSKESADYFAYARYAVVEFVPAWFKFAGENIAMLGCIFLAYILVLALKKFAQYLDKSVKMAIIREKANRSKLFRLACTYFVYPFIYVSAIFFYIPIALVILMIVPDAIGTSGGVTAAKEDVANFEGGCIHPKGKNVFCNEVYFGEELMARGFIIDTSQKYVAIVVEGVPKAIPIKDRDFLPFVNSRNLKGK